jgi:hypothetical protein
MIGVVARPAVAEADVQKTIRSKREVAAVMVRERLRDESNRDAASAVRPLFGRRKRATTVSPDRLVKLTKNRPLVVESGANARPSNPCSPPATIAADTSRKSAPTTPPRTTRMRPSCSTTNWTLRSAGSGTTAIGKLNPDDCARNLSCAPRSADAPATRTRIAIARDARIELS